MQKQKQNETQFVRVVIQEPAVLPLPLPLSRVPSRLSGRSGSPHAVEAAKRRHWLCGTQLERWLCISAFNLLIFLLALCPPRDYLPHRGGWPLHYAIQITMVSFWVTATFGLLSWRSRQTESVLDRNRGHSDAAMTSTWPLGLAAIMAMLMRAWFFWSSSQEVAEFDNFDSQWPTDWFLQYTNVKQINRSIAFRSVREKTIEQIPTDVERLAELADMDLGVLQVRLIGLAVASFIYAGFIPVALRAFAQIFVNL